MARANAKYSRASEPSDVFLREERRKRVAQLYLRGASQSEIGTIEGITPACVSLDIKHVRENWLKEMVGNYDEKVARELAKLDNLEQAAWKAWDRSMEDDVTLTTSEKQELRSVAEKEVATAAQGLGPRSSAAKEAKMKFTPAKMVVTQKDSKEQRTGQVGDPRFLEVIRGCIADRRKLMGLDAEKESDAKGVTIVNVNWDGMRGRSEIVDPVELAKLKQLPIVASNEPAP